MFAGRRAVAGGANEADQGHEQIWNLAGPEEDGLGADPSVISSNATLLPLFRPPAPRWPATGASQRQARLIRQLRPYLHEVSVAAGIPIRIVPHQLRHTYASEMVRSGVTLPALMKLLGHTSPEMTMRYVEVASNDLQREFHLARSQPRHLAPHPKAPTISPRAGLDSVVDSLLLDRKSVV